MTGIATPVNGDGARLPDIGTTPGRFGVAGATHDYSGVVVLRDVDFDLVGGQIQALIGENGSGKSTLIKVLTGAVKPTRGTLRLDGEPVTWASPQAAQSAGIAVVHQNYNLFPHMSVEHNLLAGTPRPPRRAKAAGAVDHGRWRTRVEELFERLGVRVDPRAVVSSLGPAERKFVEIARAMLREPRFVILDEPTAALEPSVADQVLELMCTLRGQGLGLAFVSHRLDEVIATADQVTVLRDGRRVDQRLAADLSTTDLTTMMIGERPRRQRPRRSTSAQPEVLVGLRDLRIVDGRAGVDLDVHEGEILAVTGLLGSGAATVVAMLGGDVPLRGTCEVAGKHATICSVRDAQKWGIGLIPEDRKGRGLVVEQTCAFNVSLASFDRVGRSAWLSRRMLHRRAEDYRTRLGIKMAGLDVAAATLSGGNQQKVMIAKLLASDTKVMAIEEPTQGVDIGGRAQIHELLRDFVAEGGKAVVVYSTDIAEVLTLADRVAVFRHGALAHVLPANDLDEPTLAALVVGDPQPAQGARP
ncbi:sugar ABC transporter ATP-binding protein [Mycobacterium sp. ITM-2016-00317]|uniref:sugar ABC transporter ATP-binding protein n=1 Tax=Mycobacterium sp. ITM-2016-00317 TaxID=2099694 RepID=UPI00287FB013|nr:sugar ABC transporter ATP-binding protein [Mycobacterium sp. ITM-2016-00317]WNG87817.1 sugar ABC transporter ATP-binding protein [Mycobacterium sp. ITM-2016-00317]